MFESPAGINYWNNVRVQHLQRVSFTYLDPVTSSVELKMSLDSESQSEHLAPRSMKPDDFCLSVRPGKAS